MTVRENLGFTLKHNDKTLSDKQVEEAIIESLKNVGLEEAIDKMPAELSGGMKKGWFSSCLNYKTRNYFVRRANIRFRYYNIKRNKRINIKNSKKVQNIINNYYPRFSLRKNNWR